MIILIQQYALINQSIYLNPYSLSYQDMILKKVEFKPIPALASTIEVLLSETKS
jgi:hypothetical protein